MVRGSRLAALAALATVVAGMTACEPVPPRLALTVTTTAFGADDTPGDGICASSAAGGACTLHAAVAEGNTAPHGADLTVPTGVYDTADETVTGDINVNHGTSVRIHLKNSWAVAPGGRLELNGVDGDGPLDGVRLTVGGSATINRSYLSGGFNVQAGGVLLANNSVAGSRGDLPTPVNINKGSVLAFSSTFLGMFNEPSALTSETGASSHLRGTVLATPEVWWGGTIYASGGSGTCQGAPVTSLGYVHVEFPCSIVAGSGDSVGYAEIRDDVDSGLTHSVLSLKLGSPLIDAIPLGDPACDPSTVDLYGNPRGVDGDGNGIGGCDIGAVEYQAAPAH